MRIRSVLIAVVALAFFPSVPGARSAPSDGPYRKIKEIAIPGEGGWDYLNADPESHHVFISHATHVIVVDPDGALETALQAGLSHADAVGRRRRRAMGNNSGDRPRHGSQNRHRAYSR